MKLAAFVLLFVTCAFGQPVTVEPGTTEAPAATSQPTVIVDVSVFPPCVMKEADQFIGFDVDLCKAIAFELGLNVEFRETKFENIFEDLANKRATVGIGGITITGDREDKIDFSHQYMRSGLSIMVNDEPRTGIQEFWATLQSVFNKKVIISLILFLAVILVGGFILWVADLGKPGISDKPFPGIFEGIWCAFATATTIGYGDVVPKHLFGRLVTMFFWIAGAVVVAMMIASMTTFELQNKITGGIQKPEDLNGKIVATVEDTTSVDTLRKLGAKLVECPTIEQACDQLKTNKVDAVVFDSPVLMYLTTRAEYKGTKIVGPMFDTQYYGIALQPDCPHRNAINRALLRVIENGQYAALYKAWFGASNLVSQ